jgi:hypothetical protein
MGNYIERGGRFPRIRSVVGSVAIKQLNQIPIPESFTVGSMHTSENADKRKIYNASDAIFVGVGRESV